MQYEVIAFLNSRDGHPGNGPVEMLQTHGAYVFLAGNVALKIKRDVRYDYMDLSTRDLRKAMLLRELELNRPTAPKIYREVFPVTREANGRLALNGSGEPVEWVLRMWRFSSDDELAVIASTKGVDDMLADELGTSIFDYHQHAPHRSCDGATLIEDILDELDRVFADMTQPLSANRIAKFHRASRALLRQITPLLRQRADNGHVRRCHGDLHLRNIVLLDGKPVPFDALEFDEVLGTCDVLYDLAFLIMDLRHRDLDRAANIALNAYLLSANGHEDMGLAALPLFLAVRAAIRAMVTVQTAAAKHTDADADAIRFLDDAIESLQPSPAKLVLFGGMSGTGKTTIARAIAPIVGLAPGAIHLRSDLERKAMRAVAPTSHLAPAAYSNQARAKVYERMFDRAIQILGAGHSVLLDGTFLSPSTREKAENIAHKTGVEMYALWLEAPLPVLIERIRTRKGDASDADENVVRKQFETCNKPRDWQQISVTGSPREAVRLAKAALEVRIDQTSATPTI